MFFKRGWYWWRITRTFDSSPVPLKEQSVKKPIYEWILLYRTPWKSGRRLLTDKLLAVSVLSLTPTKHRRNQYIGYYLKKKKSKSFPGVPAGTRRSCLKKSPDAKKSRSTVPLRARWGGMQLLRWWAYHVVMVILKLITIFKVSSECCRRLSV